MGLDIHHDAEHGRTYVVPALMAQSCEMIHPHQHCHDTEDHCCGEDGCEEDEDCCTDDFESVSITGTDPGSQVLQHFQIQTAYTVCIQKNIKASAPDYIRPVNAKGPPLVPLDISVLNCVMRA